MIRDAVVDGVDIPQGPCPHSLGDLSDLQAALNMNYRGHQNKRTLHYQKIDPMPNSVTVTSADPELIQCVALIRNISAALSTLMHLLHASGALYK